MDEAVVELVDGHLFTILWGSLRVHLTMMPRIARGQRNHSCLHATGLA
jgi:hypothetical protein